MVDVLRGNTSESHLLYDYKTDRLGQFFPLNKSARALMSGSHSISHNKMGSVNIQIEVCAQPVDWTADDDWHPGPNFRAMVRAIRSWGIADKFVYRTAKSSSDNVRRSWDTFDSTSTGGGLWWGHCHIPSPESHWDPGPVNLDRFFAAAGDTAPNTPEGETMPFLVQLKGENPVYVADTMTRRWIQTRDEYDTIVAAYKQLGWDAKKYVVTTLDGAGVLIGPDPNAPGATYEDESTTPAEFEPAPEEDNSDDEPNSHGGWRGHD